MILTLAGDTTRKCASSEPQSGCVPTNLISIPFQSSASVTDIFCIVGSGDDGLMVPSQINEHLESQSLSIELTVKISFPNSKSRDILRGVLRSNNFEAPTHSCTWPLRTQNLKAHTNLSG